MIWLPSDRQPSIFFASPGRVPLGADWPEDARFSLNEVSARIADKVLANLEQSERPLIITGFATLDRLIDFVAGADRCEQIRVGR